MTHQTALRLLTAAILLAACNAATSTPQTRPSGVRPTGAPPTRTEAAKTQTATPEQAPAITLATPVPDPNAIVPPRAGEQVYVDPEGRYVVNFPADLKSTGKPNFFSGKGGVFETGYLPKLGYMPKAINVCTWLANFQLKPEQSTIDWMPPCSVSETQKNDGSTTRYVVHENPTADPEHRFVYLKTVSYLKNSTIPVTLSWLKPAAGASPATEPVPSGSEAVSPWDNTDVLPPEISVTEYALPSEAQNPTEDDGLFRFVPTQAWPPPRTSPSATPKKTTIEELGYKLGPTPTSGKLPRFPSLYRNGRPVLERVQQISDVYTFPTASGTISAFIVTVVTEKSAREFLIQNHEIASSWNGSGMDPGFAPILYRDKLLWAKVTQDSRVEIRRSNGQVLFTFETYFAASLPKIQFRAWQGHWILEVDSFLIQDGEVLNSTYGFEQIFNWSLINDKPIYFFRKGAWVGLSYDGRVLPIQYQDVAHGLCCGPAQNNPAVGTNSIRFFGKKDGIWNYVVVQFK